MTVFNLDCFILILLKKFNYKNAKTAHDILSPVFYF